MTMLSPENQLIEDIWGGQMNRFELEEGLTDMKLNRYTVVEGDTVCRIYVPNVSEVRESLNYLFFSRGGAIVFVVNTLPWWKNWFEKKQWVYNFKKENENESEKNIDRSVSDRKSD